jgi:predicted nuclease of predicted toxin-antitoxin system
MKLLFDQNLSFKLCAALQDLFPDSVSVRAVGLDRSDDREIWKYAEADCYVLVSQDADFAEMAALLRPGPKVIWLRTGNQPTHATEQTLRRHADAILAFAQNDARCLEIY